MKLKVCGIKYKDNLEALSKLPIDYLGFIFYARSKRFMENNLEAEIVRSIPNGIKKVGVFVNEELDSILHKVKKYGLNAIQLHGDEKPEFVHNVKDRLKLEFDDDITIFKAFGIDEGFNFEKLNDYKQYCDYFLFDTKTTNYGGSGQKFNWQILQQYDNSLPLIISGGIDVEDVETIIDMKEVNIVMIDMNSKLEISPGLKDLNKVKKVVEILRKDQ